MQTARLLKLPSLLLVLLVPAAAYAAPETSETIRKLEFRSPHSAAVSAPASAATLWGADQFDIVWRLLEQAPGQLIGSADNKFYYQAAGRTNAVLPSGEKVPASKSPSPKTDAPTGLKVTENGVVKEENGKITWTYKPDGNRRVLPDTLQTDAGNHIYFQDDASNWYSLTETGRQRYVLEWERIRDKVQCTAVPSGDAVCASPAFGLIGIREKTKAPRLYIDGKEQFFSQRPEVIDGATYVPLRAIAESLGADIGWDPDSAEVTIRKGKTVRIAIGSAEASIGGKRTELSHPPLLLDGTTFVPLRFIGEALGEKVIWEEATRTIQIASP
ncbi:copper amine oxidase N-terminal domain-containing protein [Paenibacillus oceani]|uniref:Copper amine oxidase N-terminal domain-containing protein n=1 Tax=Paenibacillus oceani TaxID=2772510 RepID=A0A927CB89_9BACL|nr:copper amine oxidase N-terminal domain-containing protein [Paenibacillus oceani]MBD2864249.1 copper amine oxidase N-terminal domain-containing protein [Paenibacillus oceani]